MFVSCLLLQERYEIGELNSGLLLVKYFIVDGRVCWSELDHVVILVMVKLHHLMILTMLTMLVVDMLLSMSMVTAGVVLAGEHPLDSEVDKICCSTQETEPQADQDTHTPDAPVSRLCCQNRLVTAQVSGPVPTGQEGGAGVGAHGGPSRVVGSDSDMVLSVGGQVVDGEHRVGVGSQDNIVGYQGP